MGNKINLTGKRFGKLLVVKEINHYSNKIYWECICDCGKKTTVRGDALREGKTKSCGCSSGAFGIIPWNKGLTKNIDDRMRGGSPKGYTPWNKNTKGIMKSNKTSFEKGRIAWNKGKHHTEKSKEKNRKKHLGMHSGSKNPMFGKESTYLSGNVKWYKYNSRNNGVVKLQGTYELKFAKFLDKIRVTWLPHGKFKRFIYYIDKIKRSYSPDFYIKEWNQYIDTKGWFHGTDQNKIKLVRKYNPEIQLVIATKDIMNIYFSSSFNYK